MTEVIIPSRYVLTKTEESSCFPGVAYYLPDGTVKNEILWGHNKMVSVQMMAHADENFLFAMCHVFVERYIVNCLKRPFDNVEIFRFYMARGDYPERPGDIQGELVGHFEEPQGVYTWLSYEHISGPYLANTQYIVSQFTASRLDDISPKVSENLIPERAVYMTHPQDLPVLGVIPEGEPVDMDQRNYEDLLIRTREKKPFFVN